MTPQNAKIVALKHAGTFVFSVLGVLLVALVLPVAIDVVESLLLIDAVGGVSVFIDVAYWVLLTLLGYIVSRLLWCRIYHGRKLHIASIVSVLATILLLLVLSSLYFSLSF